MSVAGQREPQPDGPSRATATAATAGRPSLQAPAPAPPDGGLQVGSAGDVPGGAVELVADELLSGHGGSFDRLGFGEHRLEAVEGAGGLALDRALGEVEDAGHLGDRQVVEEPQRNHGPGPGWQRRQRGDEVEPPKPAVGAPVGPSGRRSVTVSRSRTLAIRKQV